MGRKEHEARNWDEKDLDEATERASICAAFASVLAGVTHSTDFKRKGRTANRQLPFSTRGDLFSLTV